MAAACFSVPSLGISRGASRCRMPLEVKACVQGFGIEVLLGFEPQLLCSGERGCPSRGLGTWVSSLQKA